MRVSPDELHATAQWLDAKTADFHGDVDRLTDDVRAVVGGSWQGAAAQGHGEAWSEWFAKVRALLDALGDHATLLRSNAETYRETDTDFANSLPPQSDNTFRLHGPFA